MSKKTLVMAQTECHVDVECVYLHAQILTELMSLVQTESKCGSDDDDGVEPFHFFWFPRFGGSSSEDVISVSLPSHVNLNGCGITKSMIMCEYALDLVPCQSVPRQGKSLGNAADIELAHNYTTQLANI